MKYLILLLLSLGLIGCNRTDARQRVLFRQAASEEENAPGDAADHYRAVVKIDATSELGRSALERARVMEQKSAEMRAAAEQRIARQLRTGP